MQSSPPFPVTQTRRSRLAAGPIPLNWEFRSYCVQQNGSDCHLIRTSESNILFGGEITNRSDPCDRLLAFPLLGCRCDGGGRSKYLMKAIRVGRRPKWKIALHLWTISALSLFPSRRAESKSNPVTIIFRHSEVSQTATISPPSLSHSICPTVEKRRVPTNPSGFTQTSRNPLVVAAGEGRGPERIPLAFFSSPSLSSLFHLRMACNEYLSDGFVLARCCLRKIKQHEWILDVDVAAVV